MNKLNKWQIILRLSSENPFLIEQMLDYSGIINTVQLTDEQAAQFYENHCSGAKMGRGIGFNKKVVERNKKRQ